MDDDLKDKLAQLKAAMDQLLATMPDFTKVLKAYHDNLLKQEFTESQALYLTAQYQKAILTNTGETEE